LDGWREQKRAQTTPDASFGPIGTCFFNINVFILFYFNFFTTTTPSVHPTPLACKREPGVGFSSPTSNQHHTTLLARKREPGVTQPRPTKANQRPTQHQQLRQQHLRQHHHHHLHNASTSTTSTASSASTCASTTTTRTGTRRMRAGARDASPRYVFLYFFVFFYFFLLTCFSRFSRFYLRFEGNLRVRVGGDEKTGPNDASGVVWVQACFFFLRVLYRLTNCYI
jgi:hypothetical protein